MLEPKNGYIIQNIAEIDQEINNIKSVIGIKKVPTMFCIPNPLVISLNKNTGQMSEFDIEGGWGEVAGFDGQAVYFIFDDISLTNYFRMKWYDGETQFIWDQIVALANQGASHINIVQNPIPYKGTMRLTLTSWPISFSGNNGTTFTPTIYIDPTESIRLQFKSDGSAIVTRHFTPIS